MVPALLIVLLGVASAVVLQVATPRSAAGRSAPGVRSVGIVGSGLIGRTHRTFAEQHGGLVVKVYDPRPDQTTVSRVEDLVGTDLILLCDTAPPASRGGDDPTAVEAVCRLLDRAAETAGVRPAVLIKCTVIMGTCRRIAAACPHLRVAFSPARHRERSPMEDFRNESAVILAGDQEAAELAEEFYRLLRPATVFHRTTFETAELLKFGWNFFVALGVSFGNCMYDACSAVGIDYHDFLSLLRHDSRLAAAPLEVPGPDGRRGWGGGSIPLDLRDLSSWAEAGEHQVRSLAIMLAAIWHINRLVRRDDEWDCLASAPRRYSAEASAESLR